MKEFVPLATTFAEGRYSSTHSSVEVFYDGVLRSTFYVSPGESTRIVAWMKNRDDVIRVLRMARDLALGDGYSPVSLITMAAATLAAAVPEPGSEVDDEQ